MRQRHFILNRFKPMVRARWVRVLMGQSTGFRSGILGLILLLVHGKFLSAIIDTLLFFKLDLFGWVCNKSICLSACLSLASVRHWLVGSAVTGSLTFGFRRNCDSQTKTEILSRQSMTKTAKSVFPQVTGARQFMWFTVTCRDTRHECLGKVAKNLPHRSF